MYATYSILLYVFTTISDYLNYNSLETLGRDFKVHKDLRGLRILKNQLRCPKLRTAERKIPWKRSLIVEVGPQSAEFIPEHVCVDLADGNASSDSHGSSRTGSLTETHH